MISAAEARAIMLGQASRLGVERVALGEALGRTLAAPVIATRAQPPYSTSAMDGYAVRAGDTPGVLRVIGESVAGRGFGGAMSAGEAVRIFTGAPLPQGADAILIQEEAERNGDGVRAPRIAAGNFIRPAGMDYTNGETLLAPGRGFDAAGLTLAAAAGSAAVDVVRRPHVAIVTGGDEIVGPGAVAGDAQIYDSVSFGLAALASTWGGVAQTRAPLRDDAALLRAALSEAMARSDLVVMAGGASVGDHDYARGAFRDVGGALLVEKVNVRPGKPTWFGVCDGKLVLGLPGNPASALVCARLFLKPLLLRMLGGDVEAATRTQRALLHASLPANGPREHYARAVLSVDDAGRSWVRALGNQDSSLVTILAAANALIVQAGNEPAKAAGDVAPVLML